MERKEMVKCEKHTTTRLG